jgi:hypothetical protein
MIDSPSETSEVTIITELASFAKHRNKRRVIGVNIFEAYEFDD